MSASLSTVHGSPDQSDHLFACHWWSDLLLDSLAVPHTSHDVIAHLILGASAGDAQHTSNLLEPKEGHGLRTSYKMQAFFSTNTKYFGSKRHETARQRKLDRDSAVRQCRKVKLEVIVPLDLMIEMFGTLVHKLPKTQ